MSGTAWYSKKKCATHFCYGTVSSAYALLTDERIMLCNRQSDRFLFLMYRKVRTQTGQSLAELAIVLPILLILLLGVFDIGNGFSTYITLSNASREGARWLTTHPDDKAGAIARIYAEADSRGLGPGSVAITLTPDKSRYESGETVTILVSHDYPLMFGVVTQLPALEFKIESTMKVLYTP